MVAPLISDDLWNLIAPLLPPARSKPKGGRPRISDPGRTHLAWLNQFRRLRLHYEKRSDI